MMWLKSIFKLFSDVLKQPFELWVVTGVAELGAKSAKTWS